MRQERVAFERSLAARLVANGRLDEAAAERALRLRAGSEERLEQILTKLGLVHEKDVAEAMSGELGVPLRLPRRPMCSTQQWCLPATSATCRFGPPEQHNQSSRP